MSAPDGGRHQGLWALVLWLAWFLGGLNVFHSLGWGRRFVDELLAATPAAQVLVGLWLLGSMLLLARALLLLQRRRGRD